MTENKRFWSEDYCVGYYTEIVDNEKELEDVPNPKKNLTIEEVVNILNELHEKNEALKEYNNKLMKQPLLFDVQTIPKTMEILEANIKLEEENEQLKKENHGIQDKVIRLLDYVEVKQCVTRTEIKKWWNGDVE